MAERNDRGGARSSRPSGDGRSGSSRPSSGGNRSGSGRPSSGGSGRSSGGRAGDSRSSGGNRSFGSSDRSRSDRPGNDRSSSDRPRSFPPRDSGSRDSGSRDSGSRSSAPRSGGYDRAPRRDDRDDRPRGTGAPRTGSYDRAPRRDDRDERPRSFPPRDSGSRDSGSRDSRSSAPRSSAPRSGGYDRAPRRDDRGPVSRSNDRRDERGRPDGQRSDNRNTSGRPSNNRRDDRGQHEQVNRRDVGYEIRDPRIPDDITPEDFDKGMSQELRSLPEGLQILVARHLVAAERAMAEEDFDLATEHVRAARRRASRISMVREACGIVAYKSGRFGEALTELRAVRRMAGGDQYIPMIADCERGLGKPQKALDYIRTIDTTKMLAETRAEMMIVAAGARGDLGELDAAIVTLQIPELTRLNPGDTRARLQYAYAMLLKDAGRANEAREWMERAAGSDIDGATDAEEQCSLMDGIEFSEED
ncbi:unannotated protein [freshwater metagenome]|uniref:Unannotated protein n=1 Tax=freshwater metagenome TaxID=449393 RepID=A0A6J7S5G6_9ZZZZ